MPALIVAQARRGGRRPLSRRAGELLGAAGTADVLDALVALVAQDRPGHDVLTSDPGNIHRLLQALNIHRTIRVV